MLNVTYKPFRLSAVMLNVVAPRFGIHHFFGHFLDETENKLALKVIEKMADIFDIFSHSLY